MPSHKHSTRPTLLKSVKTKATDEEKNLLLSLHHDFASLPDKKKFLATIWPKLKQLFDCKDVFICILKNNTLSPILRVADENRKPHAGYTRLMKADLPINDGFIDSMIPRSLMVMMPSMAFSIMAVRSAWFFIRFIIRLLIYFQISQIFGFDNKGN